MFPQKPPEQINEYRSSIHDSLNRQEALLDQNEKAARKRSLSDAHLPYGFYASTGQLLADDLQRAQQLFGRVVRARGPGSTHAQEGLINALAMSLNPDISVPFLVQALEFSQPHDSFTKERRLLALAGLALLAIQTNDATSYAALQQAVQHANANVRGQAVGYLGRAYRDAERPLPPEVQELLRTIASTDPAFLPRYKARLHLGWANIVLPLDYPDGVFLFKRAFPRLDGLYAHRTPI